MGLGYRVEGGLGLRALGFRGLGLKGAFRVYLGSTLLGGLRGFGLGCGVTVQGFRDGLGLQCHQGQV